MDYDVKNNQLLKYLKEFGNIAYHEKIKKHLKFLLIENQIKDDYGILGFIKSAPDSLSKSNKDQINFFKNPTKDHPIFEPLNLNLNIVKDKFNKITENITDNDILVDKLLKLNQYYQDSYNLFVNELLNKLNSFNQLNQEVSPEIVESKPIIVFENLEHYEINTNELGYKILSYDPNEYCYVKENKNGLSFGNIINDKVYIKVDNGNNLLRPAKENAIYELYKQLFSYQSSILIAPTQIILISKIKILPMETFQSRFLKELMNKKEKYNASSVQNVFKIEPTFRTLLNSSLEENTIFAQSSLLVTGKSFETYLNQCKTLNKLEYNEINLESYSSHIIASLLCIHTDYKPDNIFIEENTGRIIGIDNDHSLESNNDYIKISNDHIFINAKNVLYTLEDLMNKPFDNNVKLEFIKINPTLFILKWLISLYSKQLNYKKLVEESINLDPINPIQYNKRLNQIEIKECEEKIIKNYKKELGFPLTFKEGWISLMLIRFKKIQEILKIGNPTHQKLLKEIHYLSNIYYKLISKKILYPLDQIKSIYDMKYSLQELMDFCNKNEVNKVNIKIREIIKESPSNNSKEISIKETIKEIILITEINDFYDFNISKFDERKGDENIIEWLNTIISFYNDKNDVMLHQSIIQNKYEIYLKLFKYGQPIELISRLTQFLNITQKDVNESIIYSIIVSSQSNNLDYFNFLISYFKINLENMVKGFFLFDLLAINNNHILLKKFIELGIGKNSNIKDFNEYYQRLNHNEKLEFKPYLIKLFEINPRLTWDVSLNQLLPIVTNENKEDITILLSINEKRIISKEYISILYNKDGIPNKPFKHGSRPVILINDHYGNGIYFKFEPQIPGTEIAISILSRLLFDTNIVPYCELGSINGKPVLISQQVVGETMYKYLKQNKDISLIDSSNISKNIILSMIINNPDGNLGNFIIKPKIETHSLKNTNQFYIYSIDNEESFMPSFPKKKGFFIQKQTLQVCTVMFLVNQVNEYIPQDVIDRLKSLEIIDILTKWLEDLVIYNQKINNIFGGFRFNEKTGFVHTVFNSGFIYEFYSKLQLLKKIMNKNNLKITHLQLLDILEPLVSNRFKNVLKNNGLNIEKKFLELKKVKVDNNYDNYSLLTTSFHSTSDILESKKISNLKDFLKNFGPEKSLEELDIVKKINEDNNIIFNKIILKKSKNFLLSDIQLENFLKYSNEAKLIKNQIILFKFIKKRYLKRLYIRNSKILDLIHLKQLKLRTLVKIDISGCQTIVSLEGSIFDPLKFESLKILKIDSCKKLERIKFSAPNLEALSTSNNRLIRVFDPFSPNLKELNLKSTITLYNNSTIREKIFKFRKLESLNISECFNPHFHLYSKNIKTFNLNSNEAISTLYLKTKKIENFYFLNCPFLREIRFFFNFKIDTVSQIFKIKGFIEKVYQNNIEISFYNKKTNYIYLNGNIKKINYLSIDYPLEQSVVPDGIKEVKISDSSFISNIFPQSVEILRISYMKHPLVNGSIPESVKILIIHEDHNHVIEEGVIPNSLEILKIYSGKSNFKPGSIPNNLQQLEFHSLFNFKSDIIPPSIGKISFVDIIDEYSLNEELIPNGIKEVEINNSSFISDIFPPSVLKLSIIKIKHPIMIDSIPLTIKILFLSHYNYSFENLIPESIKELILNGEFPFLSINSIPKTVETLRLYEEFSTNGVYPNFIPPSIKELHIYCISNQLIINSIPNGVNKLFLYGLLFYDFKDFNLPNSIKEIYISKENELKIPITYNNIEIKFLD